MNVATRETLKRNFTGSISFNLSLTAEDTDGFMPVNSTEAGCSGLLIYLQLDSTVFLNRIEHDKDVIIHDGPQPGLA